MAVIKFNSDFDPFERVNNFMDQFINKDFFDKTNSASGTLPAVNIKEHADNFMIELAAPGMRKEDFKIEIHNRILSISSETKPEEKEEVGKFTRKEFSYERFRRSFTLSEKVNQERISATYEQGILTLVIPKKEEEATKTTRTIEIS